jgi:hypothetical protein
MRPSWARVAPAREMYRCQERRARACAEVLLNLGEDRSLAEALRAFDGCRVTVVALGAHFAERGADATLRQERQVLTRPVRTQQAHRTASQLSVARPRSDMTTGCCGCRWAELSSWGVWWQMR